MNTEDRLVIDSRLEAVAQARDWMAERARRIGVAPETVNDLKLALTEAVTNVIRHAYDSDPGHDIVLSFLADDETLTLTISNFGRQFDASRYRSPDLSEPHEGGYGIYLMRTLMDEVRFNSSAKSGNTLTLVKHRDDNPSAH